MSAEERTRNEEQMCSMVDPHRILWICVRLATKVILAMLQYVLLIVAPFVLVGSSSDPGQRVGANLSLSMSTIEARFGPRAEKQVRRRK